jgi:hypothetical protein
MKTKKVNKKAIGNVIGKSDSRRFMEKDNHGFTRKYPLCDMLQRRGSIIEAIRDEKDKNKKIELFSTMVYWDSEIIRALSKQREKE